MTQLGSSVTIIYSSRKEKEETNIWWIQECNGPKCIEMKLNIQEFNFSVNSAKKVLQRRVV